MDARINRLAVSTAVRYSLLLAVLWASMGASYRTDNFIVETADAQFAQQVAMTAEKCRRDWATEWLGKTLPNWAQPCVMTVQAGQNLGAGGATTFVFDRGEVFGWRMSIQGSHERILDSVLPHEITHMIFASHFREPLPRWADEGGATSVEHVSEKNKQRQMLIEFLHTNRGIAFNQMFAMSEYPKDILPLYAQGYTLSEYLIQVGGRRKFIEFLGDGLKENNWTAAIEQHYGIKDLGTLQNTWLAWVKQGMPVNPQAVPHAPGEMLAAASPRPKPEPNLIYHIPNAPSPDSLRLVPVGGQNQNAAAGLAANLPRPVDSTAVIPAAATSPAVQATTAVATAQPIPSIPSVVMQPAQVLPANGWRRAGDPSGVNTAAYASTAPASTTPAAASSPSTDPFQVTHPMAIEQPRQTIIR